MVLLEAEYEMDSFGTIQYDPNPLPAVLIQANPDYESKVDPIQSNPYLAYLKQENLEFSKDYERCS